MRNKAGQWISVGIALLLLVLLCRPAVPVSAEGEHPTPVPVPTLAAEDTEPAEELYPAPDGPEDPLTADDEDLISIKEAVLTLAFETAPYTGEAIEQSVAGVVLGRTTLIAGKDYMVDTASRMRAREMGSYKVTVVGIGRYCDSVSATWSIVEALPTETPTPTPTGGAPTPTNGPEPTEADPTPSGIATPTPIPKAGFSVEEVYAQTYTGGKILQPDMRVYYDGQLLVKGVDYSVSYRNNINAGIATVIIRGRGNYNGTYEQDFTILPVDLAESCSTKDIVTTVAAKAAEKTPVVYWKDRVLTKGTDWTMDIQPADMKTAGTYGVLISGKGNFGGRLPVRITLMDGVDVRQLSVSSIPDQNWTGNAVCPMVVVSYKGKEITKGFDLDYEDNVDAGTACAVLTANGEELSDGTVLAGQRRIPFKILGRSIEKARVKIDDCSYDGTAQTPPVRITLAEHELIEDRDFSVSYKKNVKVGTAEVTIRGLGGYVGKIRAKFEIKACLLSDPSIRIELPDQVYYEKGGPRPKPLVTQNGRQLKEGTDYQVSYSGKRAGGRSFTIVVRGKENYRGSVRRSCDCLVKPLSDTVSLTQDPVYKEKAAATRYMVRPILMDSNGKRLKAGVDYEKKWTYSYTTGNEVLKTDIPTMGRRIRITLTGKGNYSGVKVIEIRVVGRSIRKAKFSVADQVYTAYELMPGKIEISSDVESSQYEILAYYNNIEQGSGKMVIHGLGAYGGVKIVSFRIVKYRMG